MEYENIPDRGPTDHFHGRKTIIKNFTSALKHHRRKKDGTTFLIQGPPGAGKTALLHELSKVAEAEEWKIAKIKSRDLYTPVSMAQSLGTSYTISNEIAVKAGIRFIEGRAVKHTAGHADSVEILRHLAHQEGLILMLDEAQRLKNIPGDSDNKIIVGDTLNVLHDGHLESPVILLTAGLGTTAKAFADLGISRFMKRGHKYKIGLGSLRRDSTCATLRDLIQEYGRVTDLPSSWIEQIADRTHGWPQHIISYADQAAEYLHEHRIHTDEGLEVVLQRGRAKQVEYYRERAHDIDKENRQILADFFADIPYRKTTLARDIKSALMKEHSEERADELFDTLLHKGIIDERDDGRYGIPIPSMHTWLVEEYAKDKLMDKGNDPKPNLLPPPSKPYLPAPEKPEQPADKKWQSRQLRSNDRGWSR